MTHEHFEAPPATYGPSDFPPGMNPWPRTLPAPPPVPPADQPPYLSEAQVVNALNTELVATLSAGLLRHLPSPTAPHSALLVCRCRQGGAMTDAEWARHAAQAQLP